ncbi:MAG TPA: hypothetical protein VK427_21645, partial [Kofleriaceae bacterium]|nr:hypothetical protein [Kofleriaceae bacterium]
GKFGYMAPEQLIRGGIVDHRTDIYAAGVVLFEVLTGVRLYEAGPEPDYRTLAKKVARGEHALPSEVDPALAPYDDLVATALCPKVEDRYQTAAEFRDAIQQALVSVNPTISTDQLGQYMRELFAEEMQAQRELHDRVAKTHIADFQEQFHTQTISTISFAVAQLPLQPPQLGNPRRSGAHTKPPLPQAPVLPAREPEVVRPSPALDTMSPPTSTMLPHDDLDLADGTGTARRAQPRRRTPLVIGGVVALALLAVVVFAMTREERRAATPQPAVATAKQSNEITIVPIDDATAQAKALAPPTPEPTAVATDVVRTPGKPAAKRARSKQVADTSPKETAPKEPPARNTISRDDVANEWLAARREYAGYKNKNGTTLEKEYTDLVVYVQYNVSKEANLPETLGRIQAFRRKIRE